MVAPEGPVSIPQLESRRLGEPPERVRRHRGAGSLDQADHAVGIGPRLIAANSASRSFNAGSLRSAMPSSIA